MKVKVAETAGFCFGVKRAVDKVYQLIEEGTHPIYTCLLYTSDAADE